MHGLKKLARDLWLSRGRTLTMVLAIAVGLIGFNATLGAFGVLTREMERSYLGSVPASATLELDSVSDALLAATRQRPEVLAAARRKTIHARFRSESDGPWQRALVFVVDDFETMPVAKIFHESGAWPPAFGSVLLERSAMSVLNADVGASFWLRLPGQQARQVRAVGIAHEPALAPAQTEQAIYVYMTGETAKSFGVSPTFDELRVLLRDERSRDAIADSVRGLASWIERDGLGELHELRVPPPRHHPHQTQMTAVLVVVLIFTVLVLVMSSFLAASVIATLMARQVREIGVMKALGASKRQLGWMYTALVQVLALAAIVVAWLPGQLAARALTSSVAKLLNFDIASQQEPSWVSLVKIGVGVVVPALALLPVVWRTSGVSVRRALDDHGVPHEAFGQGRFERWVARARSLSAPSAYALRNVVRQRRQFVLSLALLGAAGAAFLTAISVAQAWDVLTARLAHTRHYDLEVRFAGPVALGSLARQLGALPGAGPVEVWKSVPTVVAEPGLRPVANTYPDDAHGAFHLVAPPNASNMLDVELEAGRWLRPDDTRAVVINQMVPVYDRLKLGDTLTLSVEGRAREFLLVGKTSQVGVGAVAYVSANTFDRAVPAAEQGGMLWVRRGAGSTTALQGQLERALDAVGAPLESVLPLSVFENALVAHFELLMKTLLALAALTAVVGGLSLGSAMSISVIARTRELAVLRTLGASRRQVSQTILLEGLLLGALSLVSAALSGGALAWIVGSLIGELSFKIPLPWTFSWSAIGLWGLGVLLLTLLATSGPAARAARLSVRDALNVL
jgi:putative ABC transport system permease protein